MTYRDRREAKADRLREWAAKRETKAEAGYEQASTMASVIPFGQPILVGHYSEGRDRRYRDRIGRTFDRSFEDQRKAESMSSRAAGIESQLDTSIYSDDPDAIERLEERIATLEAEREGVKAHNREMRKPGACPCPADCDCRSRYPRNCSCKRHPMAAYVLSNLSGNIKRNRDRLEVLRQQTARQVASESAGGISLEDHPGGYVAVTFSEKPEADVRQTMKDHGFYWRQGSWWGQRDQLPAGITLMMSS